MDILIIAYFAAELRQRCDDNDNDDFVCQNGREGKWGRERGATQVDLYMATLCCKSAKANKANRRQQRVNAKCKLNTWNVMYLLTTTAKTAQCGITVKMGVAVAHTMCECECVCVWVCVSIVSADCWQCAVISLSASAAVPITLFPCLPAAWRAVSLSSSPSSSTSVSHSGSQSVSLSLRQCVFMCRYFQ